MALALHKDHLFIKKNPHEFADDNWEEGRNSTGGYEFQESTWNSCMTDFLLLIIGCLSTH